MTEEEVRALFTLARIRVENIWRLPNGYMGNLAPLTDDEVTRDRPGQLGYVRTSDTGPTEGVVQSWMNDYRWRYARPSWLVKTPCGLIEIGWRKRVISIDWSDTPIRVIVTTDDTTKTDTSVHAWTEVAAMTYLEALGREMERVFA